MLPNFISLSRVILILPIIYLIMSGNNYLALVVFFIASFTDFLDGFLARKTNNETILGSNLDLLADKIFVCVLLIFISFHFDNFIFLIMTLLILTREFTVNMIRQYFLELGEKNRSKVNFFGKFKTFFQFLSIGVSIIFLDSQHSKLAEFLIILSALFAWLSLLNYIYAKE